MRNNVFWIIFFLQFYFDRSKEWWNMCLMKSKINQWNTINNEHVLTYRIEGNYIFCIIQKHLKLFRIFAHWSSFFSSHEKAILIVYLSSEMALFTKKKFGKFGFRCELSISSSKCQFHRIIRFVNGCGCIYIQIIHT